MALFVLREKRRIGLVRSIAEVTGFCRACSDGYWEALSKRYRLLAKPNELVLRRIIEKGLNADQIKGQLAEEEMEQYILPTLRKRQGELPLGVAVPVRASLEFIFDHAIRASSDRAARQITNEMAGYWAKGVFNILRTFEAKARRKGAREA